MSARPTSCRTCPDRSLGADAGRLCYALRNEVYRANTVKVELSIDGVGQGSEKRQLEPGEEEHLLSSVDLTEPDVLRVVVERRDCPGGAEPE